MADQQPYLLPNLIISHWILPNLIEFHQITESHQVVPISPYLTEFHKISSNVPNLNQFHRSSPNLTIFQIFTKSHRISPILPILPCLTKTKCQSRTSCWTVLRGTCLKKTCYISNWFWHLQRYMHLVVRDFHSLLTCIMRFLLGHLCYCAFSHSVPRIINWYLIPQREYKYSLTFVV